VYICCAAIAGSSRLVSSATEFTLSGHLVPGDQTQTQTQTQTDTPEAPAEKLFSFSTLIEDWSPIG
jgi:hypothetical protein